MDREQFIRLICDNMGPGDLEYFLQQLDDKFVDHATCESDKHLAPEDVEQFAGELADYIVG
jgi:hypothetical protein